MNAPASPLISPWSRDSLGIEIKGAFGGAIPASAAWPAAFRIFYIPFWLTRKEIARKLWWMNGATASGNVQCGIYRDLAGLPNTLIQGTSASVRATADVAQGTINVVQEYDIPDTVLSAGAYWMALQMDNTTGTMSRAAPSQTGLAKAANILQETTGANGLPATATPVVPTSAFLPFFGVAFRTQVA